MKEESVDHNRRHFLKLSTGVVAASSMSVAGWGITELLVDEGPVETWHKSVCRFCGTGCGVMLGKKGDQIIRVRGDKEAHNKGVICIKGSMLAEVSGLPNRATLPKIRQKGQLKEASWDEAMSLVADKFSQTIQENGADSVAYYGSGQLFCEESYTANKLFKAGIGTNNVDGNPRLCMASAAVGYTQTFGKDEPPGAYEDIDHATCFFIIGSNTYEGHPPLWERIMIRKKSNPEVKIIVVDPRNTKTAQYADIHLAVIPGTDLLLLNAIAQVIVSKNLHDKAFIEEHINFSDGKQKVTWEEYVEFLQDYQPEHVAAELGLSVNEIKEVAFFFGSSSATMSLWTMGINQRVQGVFLNNCLNSLHLISGQICRPGATPLSLTGQSNACGGVRDTGSLSHLLPGGRLVKNPQHRKEMEDIWEVPEGTISPNPGYDAVNLFRAMADDKVKACLVMCTNPAQSLPNASVYRKAMEKCFLVVADIFEDTETAKYADVILPAAFYTEKTGVYGQTERRYQLIEKLLDPPGEARSDLEILVELAERLGHGGLIHNKTAQAVWDEWRKASAKSKYNFEGITYDRLIKERGLQWPCPTEDHPGTVRRYMKGDPFVKEGRTVQFYGKPDSRAVVFLRPYIPTPEKTNEKFPLYLTTGRVVEQWHTGTMTNRVREISQTTGPGRFFIHQQDAYEANIQTGDTVEIESKYGTVQGEIEVSNDETPGVIFASFYDPAFLVNLVVSDHYDPVSKEPEYKVTAVSIKKVVNQA